MNREPMPAVATQVAEECQRLLSGLAAEELRAVTLRKMAAHANAARDPQSPEAGDRPMSGQPYPGQDTLPPSVMERMDKVCDTFEAAWQTAAPTGQPPRIEDYLGDTPEPQRSALLRELIALDIDYRLRAGENPKAEDYRDRFSEHVELVTWAFEPAKAVPPTTQWTPISPVTCREEKPRNVTQQAPASVGLAVLADDQPVQFSPAEKPAEATAVNQPIIAGYELLGVSGHGGMGVVYKARQRGLNRIVALKMILSGAHAKPEDLARFRREAATIARLQHPHIVQIYEVGEQNGEPFCALEFIDGGSLASKLGRTPQPPRQAAQLVETLAHTMYAAHQRGIIHRDLKPANVLLSADGTPKITDFGLAKQVDDDAWKTHSGVIMGTPSYMAPEQAAGKTRDIGPHTDVYALGAILYETLTGRPPFLAATQMETLDQVRHQEAVPPSRLQPKVPRDLETICLKCLEKDHQRRYLSAEALAGDLHRFLANEPIRARPVHLWKRGLKWAKRRPAIAAFIAVSVVALLSAVTGGLYLDQRARAAHQELANERRREEVRQLVLEGQKAAANKDWQNARDYVVKAMAKIGPDEPFLNELREQAWALQNEIEGTSDQLKARLNAQDKYHEFMRQHDEAFFHATLATGEGLLANLKATREAGGKALDLFSVTFDARVPLVLEPSFTESEKAEIIAGCYELLLILAEAEVQQPQQNLQHQLQQALRILDRAANLGCPIHPTQAYHLRRARYLEQVGNKPDAEKERDQATRRPPATALDYYLVGDEHYKQGNVFEAIGHFESALGQQPDHFWARYFLSVSYLRLERPRPELAKAGLTTCLSQRPGFIWLYLLRGFAYTQLKEFGAAEKDFQKALDLAPSPDALHVLYANRGVLWFQQGKYEEAVADLQNAIKLKPQEYQAYVTLAHVYQKQKEWNKAKEQLDRAVGLEPDLPFLYRLRSRLHLERPDQDLGAALRDCEKAIEVEARAGVSMALAKDHAERGRILHRSQRYQEAVTAYDVALKVDPSYANAHLWRARAQLELQNYREAGHSFDEYLKKGGQPLAEVYRTRGVARAQLSNYPEAIQDYAQALAMEPDDFFTRAARGWAYLAMGAYQLALHDFEQAVRLNPEKGDAYNGRGYARVRLGQYHQAVGDAEAALKRGPKSSRLFYDAARIYAQAVSEVQADAIQLSRQVLARDYQDRAVLLIRESLELLPAKERGPFWRDRVLVDSALSPIHGSMGFLRLATQYSESAK
jgi:serine/threonine protein kinase/tetratricopeptide (TPR) repeat protein